MPPFNLSERKLNYISRNITRSVKSILTLRGRYFKVFGQVKATVYAVQVKKAIIVNLNL